MVEKSVSSEIRIANVEFPQMEKFELNDTNLMTQMTLIPQ